MDAQIIKTLASISSALGFLCTLAYFYLIFQFRRAERSVRATVEGEGLFNAPQVLEILKQFSGDKARLDALEKLTSLDQNRATALLRKIKSGVDVAELQRLTYKHYINWAGVVGGVLLLFGLIGFVSWKNQGSPTTAPPTETPSPPFPDRVVDLRFAQPTQLRDILAECAKQVNVTLAMDQSLQDKIVLNSKGTLSSVMDQICTLEGCRWEIVAGNSPVLFVRPSLAAVPLGTGS